jgi:GNAT superfamily N-acetyltransferase
LTTAYTIRRARVTDMEPFIDLRHRMFVEVGFQVTEDLQRASIDYFPKALDTEGFVGFIAVTDDDKIVGSVGLSPYQMPPKPIQPDGRFGYVSSMYALPDHRKRGIANQLMNALIEHARVIGLGWLTLHTSEMGRPIYSAIGFNPLNEMSLRL